ncbi:MAG: polysaccharide deacetylase [Porticoccus sp.]|nr:MAG: polysaccharide deacetylase [Porticoccus sp.]
MSEMKQWIFHLAKYTGLFALCRRITAGDLRILAYHGIWLGEGHYGNYLFMSAGKFAARMQRIRALGYPVLSLSEALTRRKNNTLPANTVVLTIDDGWYGSYLHMLPELEKHQFSATLYVTTYYSEKQWPVANVALHYLVSRTDLARVRLADLGIPSDQVYDLAESDQRSGLATTLQCHLEQLPGEYERQVFLWQVAGQLGFDRELICSEKWFHLASPPQVQEMSRRGLDIQLHTHRHRISKAGHFCVEEEIENNRAQLEPLTEQPLQHFCYPSGVYDRTIWPDLKKLGIASATTTASGLVGRGAEIYALPRILDGEHVSDLEFEAELSGLLELKRSFFKWLKTG